MTRVYSFINLENVTQVIFPDAAPPEGKWSLKRGHS